MSGGREGAKRAAAVKWRLIGEVTVRNAALPLSALSSTYLPYQCDPFEFVKSFVFRLFSESGIRLETGNHQEKTLPLCRKHR